MEDYNIIENQENYYFFRALNMADMQDLNDKIIVDKIGNIEKIRTDRSRFIDENPKYDENSPISLEQVFDHIKEGYRKDTNCISLSCSAEVSISYGNTYKNKYIVVRIPKKDFGTKVINARDYMLEEIQKITNKSIPFENIDKLRTIEPIISGTENNELLISTIESAFKSREFLHYGEIPKENIINVSKEIIDDFTILEKTKKNLQIINAQIFNFRNNKQ